MSIINTITQNSDLHKFEPKKIKLFNKRYHKLELIAKGGLSNVFIGKDIYSDYFQMEEKIAIKIPNKTIKKMIDTDVFMFSEYKFLKKLRSDHIVNVLDYGIDGKTPYLILEYIEGQLFSEINWAKINIHTKNKIFKTLINTLRYIHSKNIIHADISPFNIMLDNNNNPIIIDFGISQFHNIDDDTSISFKKLKAYNPKYCSPELLMHDNIKPTFHSDIFSLAVVLYELYSNKPLFDATSLELKENPISFNSLKSIPFYYRPWFKKSLNINKKEKNLNFFYF